MIWATYYKPKENIYWIWVIFTWINTINVPAAAAYAIYAVGFNIAPSNAHIKISPINANKIKSIKII